MSASGETMAFVMASSVRQEILSALDDGAKIPTELAAATPEPMEIAHCSRALSELRDEGLVELLVPEDTKKGRLYGLTDEGEDAVMWLRKSGRLNGRGPA